ncbi:hypothetical protein, partial [Lacticaseibacillus rhamnosus]|uniref:hypothetical protein n=1 Tax=Lacticaseibacillus rhamnosus TaxID=47715 RepID=UPI0030CD674D
TRFRTEREPTPAPVNAFQPQTDHTHITAPQSRHHHRIPPLKATKNGKKIETQVPTVELGSPKLRI